MESVHKDLLICFLCNDTANSSYCLMLKLWLMADDLMVSRKYNGCLIPCGYKPEGRGFDSECVIGVFHLHILCGRTMALSSTQPLTEMSTRNISLGGGGGKGGGFFGRKPL
jgi:hypothetical protein